MTLDKDYAGIVVSSLCLIHCLAGPIFVALGFSSAVFAFFLDEKVHMALVIPIILFAAWSMPTAYGIHQRTSPSVVAICGVILLLLGLIIEKHELILTFSASLLLIMAHLSNKYFLKNA